MRLKAKWPANAFGMSMSVHVIYAHTSVTTVLLLLCRPVAYMFVFTSKRAQKKYLKSDLSIYTLDHRNKNRLQYNGKVIINSRCVRHFVAVQTFVARPNLGQMSKVTAAKRRK